MSCCPPEKEILPMLCSFCSKMFLLSSRTERAADAGNLKIQFTTRWKGVKRTRKEWRDIQERKGSQGGGGLPWQRTHFFKAPDDATNQFKENKQNKNDMHGLLLDVRETACVLESETLICMSEKERERVRKRERVAKEITEHTFTCTRTHTHTWTYAVSGYLRRQCYTGYNVVVVVVL